MAGHADPWWRRPLPVGLLGLTLMLGGWNARGLAPDGVSRQAADRAGGLAMLAGVGVFAAAGVLLHRRLPPHDELHPPDEPE